MKKYFESPKTVTNFEFVAGLQMFWNLNLHSNFFSSTSAGAILSNLKLPMEIQNAILR